MSEMISPNRLDVAIRLTLICVKFYQNEHKMSTFLTSLILIIRLSFLFGVESTVLQIESNAHRVSTCLFWRQTYR